VPALWRGRGGSHRTNDVIESKGARRRDRATNETLAPVSPLAKFAEHAALDRLYRHVTDCSECDSLSWRTSRLCPKGELLRVPPWRQAQSPYAVRVIRCTNPDQPEPTQDDLSPRETGNQE
jgi:hypothetical protein